MKGQMIILGILIALVLAGIIALLARVTMSCLPTGDEIVQTATETKTVLEWQFLFIFDFPERF